jgi:hypothetical protein
MLVDCKRLSERGHLHDEAVHRVQQPPAAIDLGRNPAATHTHKTACDNAVRLKNVTTWPGGLGGCVRRHPGPRHLRRVPSCRLQARSA